MPYCGRRHPDTNVFQRPEQRLGETQCAISTAVMNKPANADAIIWNVVRESWGMWRSIVRESRLSQRRMLERLCDDRLHPHRSQAHLLQAIVLYEWHVASPFYAIFCGQAQRVLEKSVRSTSTRHPWARYDHHNAVKSTSVLTFGLISPVGNTVVGYLIAYIGAEWQMIL